MKTLDEFIKEKEKNNSYFATDDFYILHRTAIEGATEYATEREQRYKELWGRQNELIKHIESLGIDSPFHIDKLKYERLKNKISTLEQELNLKY